jgi:Stress responsive A/B Barrel Domain
MPTRVIMIEFNPEATSGQREVFQQELKTLADKIPYKKNFHCGFNRALETEAALDAVAPEVALHGPQFVAIWEFESYDDLTRFVGESIHQKFAREIAKTVVRRRWVVNI